ncbi:glycosyltransferase family 4 protein [Roseiarcaceae bacterium H3SJ34-1]|uniref:glycosyltransferase family 4 protein n=1 Tax=Terripilifer ovatus TaxID=3032367 RepID=UPI003AB95C42|nr:glycosyltransferase family 4 protein [Roseiarcaceae bacterium H3SJ34-1]
MLIYCTAPEGGLAEHVHYQANAFSRAGVATFVITCPKYLPDHEFKNYTTLSWLLPPYLQSNNRFLKALYFATAVIVNQLILAFCILFRRHKRVLLAASSETLALIWVWPHVMLRWLGVRYAANIHDPQRKRLDQAEWWHRWSIKASFLPVEFGLVHEDFDKDQPDIPSHVTCLAVPYGCYEANISEGDGAALRSELIGADQARTIFLAFGYIADRKNIDLCIRAVSSVPRAMLVVAGPAASRHDKPASYYRGLAAELGCSDRVRIEEGFIPERMVANYFGAADVVLLSYKPEFVSQSGVLLLASNWAKPVLASSGAGPLSRVVRRFDLGLVVEPDDVNALRTAMEHLIAHGYSTSGWAEFSKHASWDRNVAILLSAFSQSR